MLIVNANGIVTLSIPLAGGRDQRKMYKEIRVDNNRSWQSNHWKNLESAYNRSPWFEHYHDSLYPLYRKSFSYLIDWNLACFDWAMAQLGAGTMAYSLSNSFLKVYDPAEYTDLRNRVNPGNYNQGLAPKYHQVFEEKLGFFPNLSILDLLFCEGKNAGRLLIGDKD